jgi:hypothetical protein
MPDNYQMNLHRKNNTHPVTPKIVRIICAKISVYILPSSFVLTFKEHLCTWSSLKRVGLYDHLYSIVYHIPIFFVKHFHNFVMDFPCRLPCRYATPATSPPAETPAITYLCIEDCVTPSLSFSIYDISCFEKTAKGTVYAYD